MQNIHNNDKKKLKLCKKPTKDARKASKIILQKLVK